MSTFSRERKPVLWGLGSVFLGIVLILLVVLWEEQYPPMSLKSKLPIGLLTHVGIALLLLGVVAIIVEFKSWRDYFEDRFISIIQKKEFLRTLHRTELLSLVNNVFQAYYRVQNLVYKDSFLEFFNTRIQKYIGDPFRDDVLGIITVQNSDEAGVYVVKEDLGYRCRMVNTGSSIQKTAGWNISRGDIVGALENYKITLTLPEDRPKHFNCPTNCTRDGYSLVYNKDHLKSTEGVQGFELSLQEFAQLDKLHVQIHVEYKIVKEKFLAWGMGYPSRGFKTIFNYPEEVEITVETFGMDESRTRKTTQPGLYALSCDSWLLPDYGLAYQFHERTDKPAAAQQTVTVAAAGSAPGPNSEPVVHETPEAAIKTALEPDAKPEPNHVKV